MKSVDNITNIVGIGHFSLDICLDLTQAEMKKYDFDPEKAKTLKDCESLLNEPYIISQLYVTSTNPLINLLMFINRTSEPKKIVEFIGSSRLVLGEENRVFESVFSNALNKANIIFIESELSDISGTLNFVIKDGNAAIKTLPVIFPKEQSSETEIESKNLATPLVETEGLTYKETKLYEKQFKKVTSLRKKSNLLSKFYYDFRHTRYLLIDVNDFLFSEYSSILSELPNMLIHLVDTYPHLKVIMNFPTGSKISKENAEILGKVISFADIVIFDKYDVIIPSQVSSNQSETWFFNKEQELSIMKDIYSYKQKGVKLGIFVEDLKRFSYLELEIENKHTLLNNSFLMNVYLPTPHNEEEAVKLDKERAKIDEIIERDYNNIKFAFLGAFFSKFFSFRSHDSSYEFAADIFRQLIDLFRNGFGIPKEQGYFLKKPGLKAMMKSSPKVYKTRNHSDTSKIREKEANFVLDCNDLRSSRIKQYIPTLDKHMNSFFENTTAGKLMRNFNVLDKSGIQIKNIFNRDIVSKLPLDADIDLKKFYLEEQAKIFPDERDLPKLRMKKSLEKLPARIKLAVSTRNPKEAKISPRHMSGSVDLTKHIKSISNLSYLKVKGDFWDKHNISIKESPYIKESKLVPRKQMLQPLDTANYTKFLSDIENTLKNNSKFSDVAATKMTFCNSNYSGSGSTSNRNKTTSFGTFGKNAKINQFGKNSSTDSLSTKEKTGKKKHQNIY